MYNGTNDGQSLPFQAPLRPSTVFPGRAKDNSFMGEFMRHLQQGADVKIKETNYRSHKKNDKSNCTTIGLQIQIRDPKTPQSSSVPVTPVESTIGAEPLAYTDQNIEINNAISNAAMQRLSSITHTMTSATYYDLDSARLADDFIVYDPQIEPAQPDGVPTNQSANIPNQLHSPAVNNANGEACRPYGIGLVNYAEQKNNASLISHFNVSHSNVSNNSVMCDQVHSWGRGANEIMLNK